MKNRKTNIIIVMCVAILLMATGYAALSTRLTIRGTSNLTDSWGVKITNIESAPTGRAYNITEPTYTNTTMSFNVGVKVPGDKMTFNVTVQNTGTLDAILDSIDATASGSYVIKYNITGIEAKTRLLAGETKTFTITTEFDIDATEIPSEPVKELTVKLSYIQDDGQTLTPSAPIIEGEDTLVKQILLSNQVKSDAGIDFSKASSDTNGKGLYYTSTNTEGNKRTYYFRGDVENNYVSFANKIWRIVRINEDGSIRLIIQDSIGNNAFNTGVDDNAYVGYMYGAKGASTYAATHANTINSTIKAIIDIWYNSNLLSYSTLIADSGFCNDRSVSTNTGIGTDATIYSMGDMLNSTGNNIIPHFSCPQTNDLFTTSTSTKGNKALTYSIGLITADEAIYAGAIGSSGNSCDSNYLCSGAPYWTMTPADFVGGIGPQGIAMGPLGTVYTTIMNNTTGIGIRPVINLKSNVKITSGDGTSRSPYVISTN